MKTCVKCGKTKPAEAFSRHALRKDGRSNDCLECGRVRSLEWARANAQKNRERAQAYRAIESGSASPYRSPLKRCSRCSSWKPTARFGSNGPSGLRSECGDCRRIREHRERLTDIENQRRKERAQYAKSGERRRANAAKNRVKRTAYINEYMRLYYQRTKTAHHRRHAEWRKKNPEVVKQYAATRRARKRGAPVGLTAAEWHSILETFDGCCAYCLRPSAALTQDHVVPLSRGGGHSADNIVPACRRCNGVKKDRGMLQIARINGLGSHVGASQIRRSH